MNALSATSGGALTRLQSFLAVLDKRPDVELTIYAAPAVAGVLAGICPHARVVEEPDRRLVHRLVWEQFRFPAVARNQDVIYNTGNFGLLRPSRPLVVLLQSHWHYGEAGRDELRLTPRRFRLRVSVERLYARLTLRRAAAIVCVSEALGAAVESDIGSDPRISVVPSAVPALPAGPGAEEVENYVLAIGTDMPHKDWDGLVAAFAGAPDLPKLRIVGPVSSARREKLAAKGAGRVALVGSVADREAIGSLIRKASCVVAHSRLESFGFVPLEGLACGVPVAAADIPAHREVCGEAAHYYTPGATADLREAVRKAVAAGPADVVAPGLDRTWEHSGDELMEIFKRVTSTGGRAETGR